MKIRKLNDEGLNEFAKFINTLRSGSGAKTPAYLLTAKDSSDAFIFDRDINEMQFSSRYEMGVFLVDLFGDIDLQRYLGDSGFWSWFALFWFDQLCPANKDGSRRPSMDYNYILSKTYNHRPRHAIYMTWQLVSRYGENARFMLSKPLSTRGELTEQMMARQEILSSQGVMELASALYSDKKTGSFKRGAASRSGAGCVSRYISYLNQLQLTYDIFSTSKADLAAILPSEFDKFIGQ